ncbi:hypothetical protein E4U43_003726 [Claviceps pusilla]|uniref:Uncharacterized protein n=1 Tax=Claviceps pusilla TaxID=123648 RepID=A0A9P7SV63_9HYPO|nr:hypothetical protein E4U43_003726 [Claviceps pusilla]
MGRDKTTHKTRSATRPQPSTQYTTQQEQASHAAADLDQRLHHLQSHYQDGRYAQFPEAARGRYALEAAAAQQQLQQSRLWQSTPASRPVKPGFLDTLSNLTDTRSGRQQQSWLDRHGLRGRDPRRQAMYPLLPARMRRDYDRRLEREERMARENQRARMEEMAAAEYRRRYYNLTYVDDLAPRGQEWAVQESEREE